MLSSNHDDLVLVCGATHDEINELGPKGFGRALLCPSGRAPALGTPVFAFRIEPHRGGRKVLVIRHRVSPSSVCGQRVGPEDKGQLANKQLHV